MKTSALLLLVSFATAISTVNADELSTSIDDYKAYCTEQAELAGIEDANELKQYIKECVESYTGGAGE